MTSGCRVGSAWADAAKALERLAATVETFHPKSARALAAIVERLTQPKLQLAFAGHFSAGKSTLLNCLLDRDVLPTNAVPETGVPCTIGRGDRDTLTVLFSDPATPPAQLPCTRANISTYVSLQRESGEKNPCVEDVSSLVIELRAFPEPDVLWIDCPGINSGPESARGTFALRRADAVLWVIRSVPTVSETEVRAICDYVAEFGHESLAIIVNVFLPAGSPAESRAAFDAYARTEGAKLRQRLCDRIAENSVSARWDPILYPISALKATQERDAFGQREIRQLLGRLTQPGSGGLLARRGERALRDVDDVWHALRAACEVFAHEYEERRRALSRAVSAFEATLHSSIERAFERFDQLSASIAAELAAQDSAALVEDPARLETGLTMLVSRAATTARNQLAIDLQQAGNSLLRWNLATGELALIEALAIDPLFISLADVPPHDGDPTARAGIGEFVQALGAPAVASMGNRIGKLLTDAGSALEAGTTALKAGNSPSSSTDNTAEHWLKRSWSRNLTTATVGIGKHVGDAFANAGDALTQINSRRPSPESEEVLQKALRRLEAARARFHQRKADLSGKIRMNTSVAICVRHGIAGCTVDSLSLASFRATAPRPDCHRWLAEFERQIRGEVDAVRQTLEAEVWIDR